MKPVELRKLVAEIRRAVPELTDHGRMALAEPRNRILRGVFLDNSSDPTRCYVHAFVQPLFEPPPFTVAFYLGQRLGGPSRTWTVADAADLAQVVARDGMPFWTPASTPEELSTWTYLDGKSDPYVLRARALAWLASRQWTQAAEVLTQAAELLRGLCLQLDETSGWMAAMLKQCEALRQLLARNPEAAYDELSQWEQANIRQLRLRAE